MAANSTSEQAFKPGGSGHYPTRPVGFTGGATAQTVLSQPLALAVILALQLCLLAQASGSGDLIVEGTMKSNCQVFMAAH